MLIMSEWPYGNEPRQRKRWRVEEETEKIYNVLSVTLPSFFDVTTNKLKAGIFSLVDSFFSFVTAVDTTVS